MTADGLTIEDELTAVRLDWLAAEAQLIELLPTTAPSPAGTDAPVQDAAEITVALHQAEQTHHAYMMTARKWAGLPPG